MYLDALAVLVSQGRLTLKGASHALFLIEAFGNIAKTQSEHCRCSSIGTEKREARNFIELWP